MTDTTLSPTTDFAAVPSASAPTVGATERPAKEALSFYSYCRSELATELTLSVFLAKVVSKTEEDELSQNAVKSLPRSWREL